MTLFTHRVATFCRVAPVLGLTLVALNVVGCGNGIDAGLRANEQQKPDAAGPPAVKAAPPQAPAPQSSPYMLEFELPAEFSARSADGSDLISGFRLGYFKPSESTPFSTVDLSRGQVAVTGRTARVPLDLQRVPADLNSIVVKLQTQSRGQFSAWSEPSPPLTGLGPPRAARQPRQRQDGGERRGQGLLLADIERHARLAEALRKVVPADAKIEDLLKGYRRLNDLAVAVVLSRDHGVPFVALTQSLQGPPRRSLRNALKQVQPKLEANPIPKARAASAQLLQSPTPQ
jgi:hypothetical protein